MKQEKQKRKYSKDDIILNIGMTILCFPLLIASVVPVFGFVFLYGGVFFIHDTWTTNCQ